MSDTKSVWNSLETTKLLAGLVMPIVIALVGYYLGSMQQAATKAAGDASALRSQQFQAAQEAQAREFQKQLTINGQVFSQRLQASDIAARQDMQRSDIRWRRLLQDDAARRTQAATDAENHRQHLANAAEINRLQEEQRLRIEAERKDSIAVLSRSIFDRRIKAVLLASALRRRDRVSSPLIDREIAARKESYDAAFAVWNSDIQANMFRIRRVLGTGDYTLVESEVEFHLSRRLFSQTDRCLTEAYDTIAAGGKAGPILDQCGMPDLLQQTLDCGYAISDVLFRMASSLAPANEEHVLISSSCSES